MPASRTYLHKSKYSHQQLPAGTLASQVQVVSETRALEITASPASERCSSNESSRSSMDTNRYMYICSSDAAHSLRSSALTPRKYHTGEKSITPAICYISRHCEKQYGRWETRENTLHIIFEVKVSEYVSLRSFLSILNSFTLYQRQATIKMGHL